MVTRYGMDEGLGHVSYSEAQPHLLDTPGMPAWAPAAASPDTAQRIDAAVQRIVQSGFDRAGAILAANRAVLDRAARALLAKETLDEGEVATLATGLVLPPQAAAAPQQAGTDAAAPAAETRAGLPGRGDQSGRTLRPESTTTR